VVSWCRSSTRKPETAPQLSDELDNEPTSQVSGGGLTSQPVAAAQKAYRGSLRSERPNPAESFAGVRFPRDGDGGLVDQQLQGRCHGDGDQGADDSQ
jgi:hypothetical protein